MFLHIPVDAHASLSVNATFSLSVESSRNWSLVSNTEFCYRYKLALAKAIFFVIFLRVKKGRWQMQTHEVQYHVRLSWHCRDEPFSRSVRCSFPVNFPLSVRSVHQPMRGFNQR